MSLSVSYIFISLSISLKIHKVKHRHRNLERKFKCFHVEIECKQRNLLSQTTLMMLSLYANKDDNEKRVLQNTQPKPERDRDRDRGEQLSFDDDFWLHCCCHCLYSVSS